MRDADAGREGGRGREGMKWMFSEHACIAGESNRIGDKETKTHEDLKDEYI